MTPGAAAPLLTRIDSGINFDWGNGSPAPSVPVDFFSARWTGFITAAFTETYTFFVPSDNGVRVWINNQLMLDKWVPQDISGWHNFTVPLTAGQATPIKVEYAELYGGASITLYWFSKTQLWESVGSNRLNTGSTVNRAPVLTVPPGQSTVRGRAATLAVQASDPDLNALTYAASGLPGGLAINPGTGLISGMVNPTASATNNVILTVSDGALSSSTSFIWNTTSPPLNRVAALSNPGTQTSIRGSIVVLRPLATDPDGDALTWSATGLPDGLTITPATGQISGTLLSSAAASYTTGLTVRDPGGLTASTTFTWHTLAPPLNGLRGEYYSGMEPGVGARPDDE